MFASAAVQEVFVLPLLKLMKEIMRNGTGVIEEDSASSNP
jgi:hypothetical protein